MSAPVTPTELRAAANQPYPHGSGFRVSANRAVLLRRAADALEAAERRMARLEAVGAPVPGDWDALLAKAEGVATGLSPYKNTDGHMTTPAPSRSDVFALVGSMRHAINYARDAERGNAALRSRLEAANRRSAELEAVVAELSKTRRWYSL